MTINSVAQDISETGYTTAGLRDEIYIQLCKQVINNFLVMFWEQLFYLIFIRCQIIQGEKVYDEAGNCWVSLIYIIEGNIYFVISAICLAFFPPSPTFYPYLLGFIQKHRDPNMDFPEVGRWPLHVQVSRIICSNLNILIKTS